MKEFLMSDWGYVIGVALVLLASYLYIRDQIVQIKETERLQNKLHAANERAEHEYSEKWKAILRVEAAEEAAKVESEKMKMENAALKGKRTLVVNRR